MSEFSVGLVIVLAIVAILLMILAAVSVVVLEEYERGVVLTLGRFSGIRNPGLRFVIPVLQQMERVDTREKAVDIRAQEALTKDGVQVKVNGVVFYRVYDPKLATLAIASYNSATLEIAQSTLRATIGTHNLRDLADSERLTIEIQRALEVKTEHWGIKVSNVEMKEVELPKEISSAMSRAAQAERIRNARVIEAEGEKESAAALLAAAEMLAQSPEAMQLRYLTTLSNIANERSSTIVFPFPTDIAQLLGTKVAGKVENNASGNGTSKKLT